MLNKKYKLLDILSPDILYMIFYISEGIIEVFLKESNQSNDRLVHLRDGIIKRLADVYSDDISLKIKEKDENEVEAYNHLINTKTKEDILLNDNEKSCLSMRLEDAMTLQQIGSHFGFTRERARQLISSALRKINKIDEKLNIKDETGIEYLSDLNSKQLDLEIQKIIENTSSAYGISIDDVLGDRRQKETILPRHIIMYKLRKELELSFSRIGKVFSKDHTTIIHAYNKIEKMLNENE